MCELNFMEFGTVNAIIYKYEILTDSYYSQTCKLGFVLHREAGQKPGVWQRKRSCFIKHVYSLLIDIFTIY